MKLKELIQTNAWLSVALIFQEIYPDEIYHISGYEEVYVKLEMMDVIESDVSINVVHQKDDFDGEEYVDVSGMYVNPKTEEQKFSQAIEFIAWNEWLGMEISEKSRAHFTELEIISHCLYEMTFIGFEEEEIQETLNGINDQMEDYLNITDEEREANTTSLEELLGDLGSDSDEENES